MLKLYPSVPSDCKLVGFIYSDPDPTILGEDMIDVVLPNGTLISCGWYPEGHPNGKYRVTVTEGFEERHRIEIDSAQDANFIVEALAVQFSSPVRFILASETKSLDRPKSPTPWPVIDFGSVPMQPAESFWVLNRDSIPA